jgi:hypothetical protein
LLVDPIDELYCIINEARERDAEDERQLVQCRAIVPRLIDGGPIAGDMRVAKDARGQAVADPRGI